MRMNRTDYYPYSVLANDAVLSLLLPTFLWLGKMLKEKYNGFPIISASFYQSEAFCQLYPLVSKLIFFIGALQFI